MKKKRLVLHIFHNSQFCVDHLIANVIIITRSRYYRMQLVVLRQPHFNYFGNVPDQIQVHLQCLEMRQLGILVVFHCRTSPYPCRMNYA